MTIGHEFVGRIVETGVQVMDFFPGDLVSEKGTWSAAGAATASRAPQPVRSYPGRGGEPSGRYAEYIALPMDQHLAPPRIGSARCRGHLRPLRQCRPHRALVPVLGEDVLITGAGPIGIMAAAVAAARRRALHRNHRRQSVPPGARPQLGRDARRRRARNQPPEVQKQLGMTRASTWAWRCPQPRRLPRH